MYGSGAYSAASIEARSLALTRIARMHNAPVRHRVTPEEETAAVVILLSTVETLVHLHKPVGGTYCGATVTDRATEQTAYRSEATCPACIGTLR